MHLVYVVIVPTWLGEAAGKFSNKTLFLVVKTLFLLKVIKDNSSLKGFVDPIVKEFRGTLKLLSSTTWGGLVVM